MRCLVVGSPISHSLSPAMHRAAYASCGLDWQYDRQQVPAGQLAQVADSFGTEVRGLSVTAPLKLEAAALASSSTAAVEMLGAANTLTREPEGSWAAANTDVTGVTAALSEAGITPPRLVRILGAGATAQSVVYALSTIGAQTVEFAVRDERRAANAVAFAAGLGMTTSISSLDDVPRSEADLLVSTVPVSANRQHADAWLSTSAAVFDAVYDPWPTALMSAADRKGVPVVTGVDLLAHQAVGQLELMAGIEVDADILRTAALTELDTAGRLNR